MKKLLPAVFTLFVLGSFAQADTGMHFTHGLSWKQVQEKAKAENKYIFVDGFTTWCGPCRVMSKNIFPQAAVGDFYNANYINIKVQLDTTAKDNEEVKGWYTDAHDIMTQYKVNVFPTYLFFSPGGKLVHRAVGSSEAPEFIAKGKDALDSNKQYYSLAEKYNNGQKDPAFLKLLAEASYNAYDRDMIGKYSNEYLNTQTDFTSKENLQFLDKMVQSSNGAGFDILVKNREAFNKVNGPYAAENRIREILLMELYPVIFRSEQAPDWDQLQAGLKTKYPFIADEVIANAKVNYYYRKEDYPTFTKAVSDYVKQFGNSVSAPQLNQYAWRIFENCMDMNCINQALQWSKKSVDLTNNPMFIDTYANLLYKSGKKKDAIAWEEKAIKKIKDSNEDASDYEGTLEKMKKDEKTW